MRCISWKIRGSIILILCAMVISVILHPAAAFAASAYTAYDPLLPPVVVTGPLYIASSDSIGLDARNGGTINSSYDVAVSGDRSYGGYAIDGGALNITGNIKVSGDLSTAMYAGNDSDVFVQGDISMLGNGQADNAQGYRSFSLYAAGAEVTVDGNISTSGDLSTALYAKDSSITVYGTISADGNGNTNPTIGNGSHAVNAVNSVIRVSGDIITNGTNNFGIHVTDNSYVYVDGEISTKGLRVQGVNAQTNSVVYVSGDITSDGASTTAINAAGGTTVNARGNVTALDDTHLAKGVHAVSASNVNVSGDVTAIGTQFGNGIEAFDSGTTVTVDGNLVTESKYTRGIDANGSVVTVGGNLYAKGAATEQSSVAEGIYAYDYAKVSVGGNVEADGDYMKGVVDDNYSTINVGGNITVNGYKSYGAYSRKNASVDITGSVSTAGYSTVGAYSVSESAITIGGDVKAEGEGAKGIWATTDALISVGGNIGVSGSKLYGAYASINSVISVDGTIEVDGDDSYGAYISTSKATIGGGVKVEGARTFGVHANSNSTVNITGDIDVTGENACGVYANGSSTLTVRDGVMNSSGDGSMLIRVGKSVVSLDNVSGSADGGTLLYTSNSGNVYAENGTVLFGNVINDNTNSTGVALNLQLDGASSLTGTINDKGRRALTNFTLATKDDAWHVTDTSTIRGSLDNSGVVDYMSSARFTNVTVGSLGANGGTGGTYIMKADVARETADNLIVTQTTDGSYKITVNNDGSQTTTGEELTTLVRTADQGGSFELSHLVEAGAWQYSLRQVSYAGGNAIWELYATDSSNTGSDAVNSFYASYLLGYAHMETLIKRLGDLRETPDESGVWARLHGGKFESKAGSYAKPFDMKYWGVHAGYDRKLEYNGWKGDSYAGIFFGWGKGDIDYLGRGSGDAELKEIGLYGTWLNPNGFFADLVFKYQWIDNDFRAIDSAGDIVNGSGMTTGGFGGSLELGQRIHFADREDRNRKTGWYAEPQVQLSITRYKGDYFRVSNGMIAGADGFTSIIGRLGALVGYENESKTSNLYLKAFRLREFEADINAYINGVRISDSYKGSWWVYGLGYTGKINDKNSVYFDIERTSGAKFDQLWSVRLGWRHTF